ncbi:MAG: DNA helicase RecQ, partial [Deltaproteobacteria bacterium]|nr:DNA helicase RecQ [Deltaproteobacteria bacterium]
MPPLTRIICLANSRKHGAYCLAGVGTDSGEWIRPVSDLEDGRLERSMLMVGGQFPKLGQVIEIPLDPGGPDFGFEKENRSILPGPWRLEGSVSAADLLPFCSRERFILHNSEGYVTVEYLQSLPFEERRTLQLVEAFEFQTFDTGPSVHGGRKWDGSFVSRSGERLRTRITDPVLAEKLETGYQPGAHCMITISLSLPFCPKAWQKEGLPCWKLIAGIIEFQPGKWAKKEGPFPAAPGARRGPGKKRGPVLDDGQVKGALKKIFGFDSFRPLQQEVVRAILDGRDCFVVMPTGGGKSLCFQLPAHLLPGTCLVISPLISLMKDQVDAAQGNGLRAAFINSSQTDQERLKVFGELQAGRLDLLYVSPERLAMETFLNHLKRAPLSLVAIDEAHCISEWGHDFRPDYLSLSEMVTHFPGLPVAAFTATATRRVQQDIVGRLGLRNPHMVRASFDRPNLFYEVSPKTDGEAQILDFVKNHRGESGIVYRTTRESVEETARLLLGQGIPALPYHAGLDDETRRKNQEAFNRDKVGVIVATIAFGMRIDKSNVRFVLHGDLPKSLEAYYQETGRAGRDGESAHCLLLFGRGDIAKQRYFIDQISDQSEWGRSLAALNEMVNYASDNQTCRRRRILAYFGEVYGKENCGACDGCCGEREAVDLTQEALIILKAIDQTGERFGAGQIIDIVKGANTQKIRQYKHDRLSAYGTGKPEDKRHWRRVIDDLLALSILGQAEGEFPVLQLTREGEAVLKGRRSVTVMRERKAPERKAPAVETGEYGQGVFERLRTLRLRLAAERRVPPYVIFSDRSLREMADLLPLTKFSFLQVHGVGETKWAQYGQAFIDEIKACQAADTQADAVPAIEPAIKNVERPLSVPAKPRKSSTIEETFLLAKRNLSLEQIAHERGLTEPTIALHLEQLILAGRAISLDRFVRPEVRKEVEDLINNSGLTLLREIVEQASIPVTYEEARLVRAR